MFQRLIPFLLGLTLGGSALAQYQHENVELYRHYTLSEFSSGSGNSCWGYVSPSGREYAIMGLDNKTAFVEITDPKNTQYFAQIPHSSGLWSDVKVYKNALYVVTENSGSGVQVIDLSNIDNHQVTLVKTLTKPGRSHTIFVDTDSGFLYNCGTNEGTGTTMAFSLADPLNPVQVGSNSLTPGYIHECQVITYKSGPYAGKQIFFGGGTQRGLEIYDVTDKSNVKLIRRITYPFVGYCHQVWLSEDLKYAYVNDEFDESQQSFNVRTLVFDVSVLETADLVSTYTNGRPTIDHNIYVKNGFIFHSNYTSGFWIFDGNSNPTNPTYRGYFDTYPSGDPRQYNGTWSNYDFFPSGTCIISDLDDGLFIVDVSNATKTPLNADVALAMRGSIASGGPAELSGTDGKTMDIDRGLVANIFEAPITTVFEGKSPWKDISKIQFKVVNSVNAPGLNQRIELYDWTTRTWVQVYAGIASQTMAESLGLGSNPDRFVDQTTLAIRARVRIGSLATPSFSTSIDEVKWIINP